MAKDTLAGMDVEVLKTEVEAMKKELFNLQCWALTCESFFSKKEWVWLLKNNGYTGDYEFIYFE